MSDIDTVDIVSRARNIAKKDNVKLFRKVRKPQKQIIQNEEGLNEAMKVLPTNYNFEIKKCLIRIIEDKVKLVALQLPEGLAMYACTISDILEKFGSTEVIILADVTYGACCIDDFTAWKLGAQLLIHYGHSCLVPISATKIKVSPTLSILLQL